MSKRRAELYGDMNASHWVWCIYQPSGWQVHSGFLASHSNLHLSDDLMAETLQITQWRLCSSMNIQSANANGLLHGAHMEVLRSAMMSLRCSSISLGVVSVPAP